MRERYAKKSARPGAKRKRDSAQPQERSNRVGKYVSDLPRHAAFKVALHLLDRRGAPSSKEGIGPCRNNIDKTLSFFQAAMRRSSKRVNMSCRIVS